MGLNIFLGTPVQVFRVVLVFVILFYVLISGQIQKRFMGSVKSPFDPKFFTGNLIKFNLLFTLYLHTFTL